MNIIVVGGGKVGEAILKEIADDEDISVTLIEINENVLEKMTSRFDIKGILGSGVSIDILKEADIENADFFIAVSQKDEINIISSIISKKLGAKYTIARIRDMEYSTHMKFFKNSLGISKIINPDLEAAFSVYRMVKYIYATSIETFIDNSATMVGVKIDKNSKIKDMQLKDFRKEFDIIVFTIQRGDETFIPNGDSVIREDDIIHVTGAMQDMHEFYLSVGFLHEKKIKSVLIIGGGKIATYLIPLLKKMKLRIKIIERDYEIARTLSENFSDVSVICQDGTDQDVLDELMIESFDACIALTGVDEENALISLYARSMGVRKTIAKINRVEILKLINQAHINSIITPKRLIADNILRTVLSMKNLEGSNIEQLYSVGGKDVKALQFTIKENAKVINTKLQDMQIKKNTIIAIVSRDYKIFFPSGKDMLKPLDKVIVVTKHVDFNDIDDILE